jgi:toxin YoeB
MRLAWTARGWADYVYWQTADRAMLKRINRLIDDALRTPREGIGKPELLRYRDDDAWSRRITEEHRLVYVIEADSLVIVQARFHYGSAR